jgi:hypothetical protein
MLPACERSHRSFLPSVGPRTTQHAQAVCTCGGTLAGGYSVAGLLHGSIGLSCAAVKTAADRGLLRWTMR